MMPRMNFWSIGRSSSSAARAVAGCTSMTAPSVSPKAALALSTFVRRIVFIRNPISPRVEPLNCRDSCVGSGRFCGAFPCQRLIQQANNPSNDGHIGQVENVPVELPICRRNVKKDEIGNPTIGQTVDGVADGPANDQSQGKRGESVLRLRKPKQQEQSGTGLNTQQNPLTGRSLGLEQAVADARVACEDNIDEWADPDRPIRGEIEHEQQ